MKKAQQNLIASLLKEKAEQHKQTFGKEISWKKKEKTDSTDPNRFSVDVFESTETGYSWDAIAKIMQAVGVSGYCHVTILKDTKTSPQDEDKRVMTYHIF